MVTSPVSILIQWSRVPCINRNSNITGYTVHYSTGGGSTESVSVSGTDQSERTYTATLLVPSTSYSILVVAVTSTGTTGPFSTTVTETTSPPRSESVRYSWLITCVHCSNLITKRISPTEHLHILTYRYSCFEWCYHPKPWFCTIGQCWWISWVTSLPDWSTCLLPKWIYWW